MNNVPYAYFVISVMLSNSILVESQIFVTAYKIDVLEITIELFCCLHVYDRRLRFRKDFKHCECDYCKSKFRRLEHGF